MKHWNDVQGSTFFNMIFSSPIAIGEINLFTLKIENDYSTVIMGFDIPETPDAPPRKWKNIGFNTCRIGITCSEIEELFIINLPNQKNFQLTIEKIDSRFKVSATAEKSSISFTTSFINLRDPNVYLKNDPHHKT
ncbi:Imm50 family immunity protein [Pseudomonas helmanticensis]|uniref:Imm50 family immunity protein n=1 Tax=Pseudomonas helmanticensis TaxID=1471381 RepID=UPI0038233BBE